MKRILWILSFFIVCGCGVNRIHIPTNYTDLYQTEYVINDSQVLVPYHSRKTGELLEVDTMWNNYSYQSDTLWLDAYSKDFGVGAKKWRWRGYYLKKKNEKKVLFVNYKSLPGIRDHIDEFSWVYNPSSKIKKTSRLLHESDPDILILKRGSEGFYNIAYRSDSTISQERREQSSIFRFDLSRLASTRDVENVWNAATGNLKVYLDSICSANEVGLVDIRNYYNQDSLALLPRVDVIRECGSNSDSLYFHISGFNQTARDCIDAYYGRPIKGNVLSVVVGKKPDLIDDNWRFSYSICMRERNGKRDANEKGLHLSPIYE